MKLTVLDLDSITFIIAYNHKEEDRPEVVANAAKNFINTILLKTEADCYVGFYQKDGHENYRNEVVPAYKKNRPPTPDFVKEWKPTIHDAFNSFPGIVGLGVIESDDALSIIHHRYSDYIEGHISSNTYDITYAEVDKDLKCIPGKHYNYTKDMFFEVNSQEANIFAKIQILTGDGNDGVPGIPGIGPAKALPYVEKYESVVEAFKQAAKDKKVRKWITLFYQTYSCINLLTTLDELKKYTKREEVDIFKIHHFENTTSALEEIEDWE